MIMSMSVGMVVIMRMRKALIITVGVDDRMARFNGPLRFVFNPGHDRV
jgi:hypothetical protein